MITKIRTTITTTENNSNNNNNNNNNGSNRFTQVTIETQTIVNEETLILKWN